MATLHVHVDESGDFNFSPSGTRYYVFTAAWTYDPFTLSVDLSRLRYGIIKSGHGSDLSSFHACQDPQPRRELVIAELLKHRSWNFASMVVDKPRVNPTLREPGTFYPKFASMVLRFIFRGRVKPGPANVLIYSDTLPMDSKKKALAVEVAIKGACRRDLPVGTHFEVCNHRRESNPWIQIADYCSWAVFRKWEHGNTDAYNRLRARIAAAEIDPMSRGDGTVYY